MLEKFGQNSQSAARTLNVKSALNPLLWLTAISTPVCFGGAFAFKELSPIFEVLVITGILPIVITCLGFCYFAVTKPEKLQSEDYQLRHESLLFLQQKSDDFELPTSSLEQIINPMNSLENKRGEK